jgi:hypothetical protein
VGHGLVKRGLLNARQRVSGLINSEAMDRRSSRPLSRQIGPALTAAAAADVKLAITGGKSYSALAAAGLPILPRPTTPAVEPPAAAAASPAGCGVCAAAEQVVGGAGADKGPKKAAAAAAAADPSGGARAASSAPTAHAGARLCRVACLLLGHVSACCCCCCCYCYC